MGITINKEELKKIPYLDHKVIRDRSVNIMPFWDGKSWNQWIPTKNGIIKSRIVDLIEGEYLGKKPCSEYDLVFRFIEFMWQRASWPELCPIYTKIKQDMYNLSTALQKIDLFFAESDEIGLKINNFVETEIEYIFMVSRSIFDLFQKFTKNVWGRRIQLTDPEKQKNKKILPDTFSQMLLCNGIPRNADELVAKYGITTSMAKAYEDVSSFFISVKSFRDEIIHHGESVKAIFKTEKGFCVSPKDAPFNQFDIWKEEHKYNDNISSLKPYLAQVVIKTILSLDRLMEGLVTEIQFPEPIAPGLTVFSRNSGNKTLVEYKVVLEGGNPWWI